MKKNFYFYKIKHFFRIKYFLFLFVFLFVFFPKFLFASSSNDLTINYDEKEKYIKRVFNEKNGTIEQEICDYKYVPSSSSICRKKYYHKYYCEKKRKQSDLEKNKKEKISKITKSFSGKEIFISEEEEIYRNSKTLVLFK